jgi:hypothetical protein
MKYNFISWISKTLRICIRWQVLSKVPNLVGDIIILFSNKNYSSDKHKNNTFHYMVKGDGINVQVESNICTILVLSFSLCSKLFSSHQDSACNR